MYKKNKISCSKK